MAYRFKEYFCGDYLELEIFAVTKQQMKQSRKDARNFIRRVNYHRKK